MLSTILYQTFMHLGSVCSKGKFVASLLTTKASQPRIKGKVKKRLISFELHTAPTWHITRELRGFTGRPKGISNVVCLIIVSSRRAGHVAPKLPSFQCSCRPA